MAAAGDRLRGVGRDPLGEELCKLGVEHRADHVRDQPRPLWDVPNVLLGPRTAALHPAKDRRIAESSADTWTGVRCAIGSIRSS